LEIDRGTEYQQKFKQHVRARIEFIRSGKYIELFGTEAVTVAYLTTGERPEYRETRRKAMCGWTQEVLVEQKREKWTSVFRFCALSLDEVYMTPLFESREWYLPGEQNPISLFASEEGD
jgi:hypothetical protein